MPLSATFIADFASFSQACDDADVKLKTFEMGAGKVETSITRMSNSLSGTKLIQDATMAAEAVDRVGGVSTLTEKQLARLSAQATEAVEKMKRLGMDVPPGIQKIAAEAKVAETGIGSLGSVAKEAGAWLVSAFALKEIGSFVSGVMEAAHDLEILSFQTQINTTDLQILGAATREFGIEGDQLARGLYQLSRRIAGGDESASTALHMMGMSLDDLAGKTKVEMFETIMHGLAGLQGSLRDTASADLFGARIGASMATASTGIDAALKRAKDLNTFMTKDAIEAASEYEHSIDRVKLSLSAMTANLVGPVAKGFNEYVELVQKAGFWTTTWARFKDSLTDTLKKDGTAFDELAAKYGVATLASAKSTIATEAETAAREEEAAATTAQGNAAQFMSALQIDALKKLTPEQQSYLEQLKEMGELNAKNAAAIGIGASQFKNYTAAMAEAKKMADDLAKTQEAAAKLEARDIKETAKLWGDYNLMMIREGGTANEIAIAGINERSRQVEAAAIADGRATKGFYAAFTAETTRAMAAVGIDWDFMRAHSLATLQETAVNARATYDAMMAHSGNFTRETLQAQLDKTREAEMAARLMGRGFETGYDGASKAAKRANDELAKTEAAAKAAAAALRAMGSTFEYDLTTNFGRAQVEQMNPGVSRYLSQGYSLQQAMELLMAERYHFQATVGAPDNPRPPSGTYPGFAAGVQNFTGGPAIVGERGPELLNLPRGSSVIPLGGGGGGSIVIESGAVQITQNYPIMRDRQAMDQIGQVVGEAIVQRLTAQGWRPPLGVRR